MVFPKDPARVSVIKRHTVTWNAEDGRSESRTMHIPFRMAAGAVRAAHVKRKELHDLFQVGWDTLFLYGSRERIHPHSG